MTDQPDYALLRDTPHRARLVRLMDRIAPFGMLRRELIDTVFDIEAAALAIPAGADSAALREALVELHEAAKAHRCDHPERDRYPINECGPDCYVDRALQAAAPQPATSAVLLREALVDAIGEMEWALEREGWVRMAEAISRARAALEEREP